MSEAGQSSEIARAFADARRRAVALDRFPGPLPGSLDDAYRIQDAAIAHHGGPFGGWKVGRVLPPFDARLGADRLGGPIVASRITNGMAPVGHVFGGGFGAAEAEYLFLTAAEPAAGQTHFTLDEAAALIDRVHVGIEIASSPLATINALGPTSVVSDFGNNNGAIVGAEIADWRTSGFADWDVTLDIDGRQAGYGRAAAFPDGPVGAVRFLIELLARRGIALPAGSWISSGAITGVHQVAPGQRVVARFGNDYETSCTIEAARPV